MYKYLPKIKCLVCKKLFKRDNPKVVYCSRTCYGKNRKRLSLDKTIWSKVNKTETCWLWTGPLNAKGYGCAYYNGKCMSAHRAVYFILVGIISDGLEFDHKCRVRNCVNPEHLEPVTHTVNLKRSPFRGGKKFICKRGHVFTTKNTRMQNGTKVCLICSRESQRRSYQKNREKTLARQRERYKSLHPNSQSRDLSHLKVSRSYTPRLQWRVSDLPDHK